MELFDTKKNTRYHMENIHRMNSNSKSMQDTNIN
jgi:hypothetical protein